MTEVAAQRRWNRIALQLVIATLAYNVIEAGVALGSGFVAGSIALIGFGLDSVIETAAAGVLLWRLYVEFRGDDAEAVERTEQRVMWFVGLTFLLLALYVLGQYQQALACFDQVLELEPGYKKAIVTLAPGGRIDLFEGVG